MQDSPRWIDIWASDFCFSCFSFHNYPLLNIISNGTALPAANSRFVFLHFTHKLFGHKLFWPQSIDDAATFFFFGHIPPAHGDIF